MHIVMLALMGVGYLAALVGGIWMVVNAFKTSVGWGLGTLFLWLPVGLIFLVKNWQSNKKPFFIQLAGVGLLILSAVLLAQTSPDTAAALGR